MTIEWLKKLGERIYPVTHAKAVITDDSGGTLDVALEGKQARLTFDTKPTTGSPNPVTSDGVAAAIFGAMEASY